MRPKGIHLLKSGEIKAAANVRSAGVVGMLQRAAAKVPDGKIRVGVGFSAQYALYLHEKKEMKWKGLPRGSLGGYEAKKKIKPEDATRIRVLKGAIRFAKDNAKYRSARQRADAAEPIQKELKSLIQERVVKSKRHAIHRGYYWDPQDRAQPQFLVGPFREMRDELNDIIRTIYAKTGDMEKALLAAGLRLQREAQQRVPVEFGFLKASAWTRRLT
jgi:hypothetical protein